MTRFSKTDCKPSTNNNTSAEREGTGWGQGATAVMNCRRGCRVAGWETSYAVRKCDQLPWEVQKNTRACFHALHVTAKIHGNASLNVFLFRASIKKCKRKSAVCYCFEHASEKGRTGLFIMRFETDPQACSKRKKKSTGTLIKEDKQTHTCTCLHTAHAPTDSLDFGVWLPFIVISEALICFSFRKPWSDTNKVKQNNHQFDNELKLK